MENLTDLCRLLIRQNINVIFTTVGLFNELFLYNRKNLKNYVEIYIKTDIEKLKKNKSKTFYKVKTRNVWGLDLNPQFPKKPDIIIENNFQVSPAMLAKKIFKKIKNIKS